MANAAQAADAVGNGGDAAVQGGNAFLTFLGDKGPRLLVVAIIIALLVFTIYYMRKRFPIVREFMTFLVERKLWWMTPIVVIFVLLAALIVTMEHGAIAPFIYALF